jgi:hypothetical protein
VGKFLNPSGRLECRQGQVGLCQLTAKLSTVFSCVGRPTLAGNVGVCTVAGIGGLGNEAKRNAKTDQLRPVPRDKCK